jgi:hypothetical protein
MPRPAEKRCRWCADRTHDSEDCPSVQRTSEFALPKDDIVEMKQAVGTAFEALAVLKKSDRRRAIQALAALLRVYEDDHQRGE